MSQGKDLWFKGFGEFLCDKNYTPAPDINLITDSINLPHLSKKGCQISLPSASCQPYLLHLIMQFFHLVTF